MPVRDASSTREWLACGICLHIGWSNTIGCYEGFSLLTATDRTGVLSGFCLGTAASSSSANQRRAETFFGVRASPNGRLISAGSLCPGPYVADKGLEAEENHRRWLEDYTAEVIHPPQRSSRKRSWPKRLRRWVASIRQEVVETVYDKLFNALGLWRERPHELEGLRAPLAARVALHNFCMWLKTIGPVAPGWPSPTCWDGDLNSHQAFKAREQEELYERVEELERRLSVN
jgi:hypothetical protein